MFVPQEPVPRLPYVAEGTFVGAIKVKKLMLGGDPGGPSAVTRVLKGRKWWWRGGPERKV